MGRECAGDAAAAAGHGVRGPRGLCAGGEQDVRRGAAAVVAAGVLGERARCVCAAAADGVCGCWMRGGGERGDCCRCELSVAP